MHLWPGLGVRVEDTNIFPPHPAALHLRRPAAAPRVWPKYELHDPFLFPFRQMFCDGLFAHYDGNSFDLGIPESRGQACLRLTGVQRRLLCSHSQELIQVTTCLPSLPASLQASSCASDQSQVEPCRGNACTCRKGKLGKQQGKLRLLNLRLLKGQLLYLWKEVFEKSYHVTLDCDIRSCSHSPWPLMPVSCG